MSTFTVVSNERKGMAGTSLLYGIAAILMFSLLLLVAGCGGNSTALTAANTQLKIGDAPSDSVIAFELTVTSVSLTDQGGNTVSVFSGSREIELAHLAATVEPLNLANVPAGTYTKASIGYSGVEVTYIPTAGATPVQKELPASGTASANFTSPITVGNGTSILSFDVDLAQSLTFDASGNLTAVNPVFTVSAAQVGAEADQDEESGEIEDAVGAVSAAPTANSFSVTLKSGQAMSFSVDTTTKFSDGLTAITDLKQGMLVQVDAVTQADGSLLAKKVELVEAQGDEAEGIVTTVTSPLTSFTIIDADGTGSGMTAANLGAPLTVNVGASTAFRANTDHIDMSGLSFTFNAPAQLAVGQNVEIEASGTVANNTVTADKVVLQKQALTGAVSSYVGSGTQGTFTLTLPADSAFAKLTGIATVTVHQQSTTELKGLTTVGNNINVRVRGMLFWDGANYQFVASRITTP